MAVFDRRSRVPTPNPIVGSLRLLDRACLPSDVLAASRIETLSAFLVFASLAA